MRTIGQNMTAAELIEILSAMPPTAPVYVTDVDGNEHGIVSAEVAGSVALIEIDATWECDGTAEEIVRESFMSILRSGKSYESLSKNGK